MGWRNSTARYGSLAISLHWLMLLLLAAVFASMELRGVFPKGSAAREAMKTWHYMLGLSVLVLALLRLVLRGATPAISPAPPQLQEMAATAMKVALYGFMLAMPLLGWLLLSADGKDIPFFGWQLAPLIAENHALAETLEEVHETGATIGYVLIGLHAAAALYHHYLLHDDTLRRMLPTRRH
ncbi:MAG: cytochrome b [Massilia sp.]